MSLYKYCLSLHKSRLSLHKSRLRSLYKLVITAPKNASFYFLHPGVPGNLALFTRGVESSRFNKDTGWWRAIDGKVEDSSFSMHSVSKLQSDPWMRWDLLDIYLVQTVELFSRTDCCLDEMETLEVRVGMFRSVFRLDAIRSMYLSERMYFLASIDAGVPPGDFNTYVSLLAGAKISNM